MSASQQTVFEFGDFRIDPRRRSLARCGGEVIALTPKQFDTLLYLVENADEVLDKDRIMDAVWPRMVVEENNLNQAISQLRRILGDDGAENRYILTVPRRGYRFVAEVRKNDNRSATSPPPAVATTNVPADPVDMPMTHPATAMPAQLVTMTAPVTESAASAQPPATDVVIRTAPRGNRAVFRAALIAVAILAVVAAGLWRPWQMPETTTVAVNGPSIAVLPFANFSGAKEDEFFSAGITEDLITQLAQISGLKVISRTSMLAYRDSKKSLRDIAHELGVAHILQGSVRRSDTRFRINAQLIDPEREGHLWAKSYDRDIKDVLAVQSEVTAAIAEAMKARLLAPEKDQLDRRARGNPEAFLAYLKGVHELRPKMVFTLKEYDGAQGFFEEAMRLDPTSPLGALGMADMYITKARVGLNIDANYAAAEKYALQALALDKTLGEAHAILARVHGPGQYNWRQAEIDAKRAVELAPGASNTWESYRIAFLEPTGRLEEALAAEQRAVSLDPRDPFLILRLALLHVWLGQCDQAIKQADTALEIFPYAIILHTVKVNCYEAEGKFSEAIAANRLTKAPWADKKTLDAAERAISIQGNRGYTRVMLAQQIEQAKSRKDVWYYAAVYAGMSGEWDEAFRYLDKAIDLRDRNLVTLKNHWVFREKHADPRYLAALKRMNLD